MKKIFMIGLTILLCPIEILMATNSNYIKTSLSGKITDKQTGEALTGVLIYIPDLKTGTISDSTGNYKIDNLPKTNVLIQLSLTGYKKIIQNIDLSKASSLNFSMEPSIIEMNEVVVTGLSRAARQNRMPAPISTVSRQSLLQNSSTNIIDALAHEPGMSQVTTGPGISKPVIRGLGYNRVVVVNDGIRQEGQQWGDEHGIEIDENTVDEVEILKGPASLVYGSDAMAGVINMISNKIIPEGKINGNISTNYQTNNGLIDYSGNLAGNHQGFIWDARFSNKLAHDYQNKYDGYVFNSGFRENATNLMLGLNKSWGYSHLTLSTYNLKPGIIEGERDSLTGKFVKAIALSTQTEGSEIATNKDFMSYNPAVPYQNIHHYKAALNSNFYLKNGNLKTIFGFQQNQRQEYANILNPNEYGLYFLQNTLNYDINYVLNEKNNLSISFGANGMYQTSRNKGSEYLVPEYHLFDAGLFTILKKSFDKLDLSGGLRFDSRNEDSRDFFLDANEHKTENTSPGAVHKFKAFNSTFSGISGSIGATYQFSESLFTKLNISEGFRAPNIDELGSNGVHDGTIRYEIGNPGLKAEHNLQFDYALGLNTDHVLAEIDLFENDIRNYIFSHKLNNSKGADSITDGYETFKFFAGNAQLRGGEVKLDVHPHPLDWLHFENSFSYVRAEQINQPDSTRYLPFIPPARFQSALRANKRNGKIIRNAYIQVGLEYNFKQDKFYKAFGTETETPAYTLINMGTGADICRKNKTIFSVYLAVNNLADVAYQNHLSRLKYENTDYSTSRTGVYNMGRNISFKLIVPFEIK